MKKLIRNLILTIVAGGALLFPALIPLTVNAQGADIRANLCGGVNLTPSAAPAGGCDSTAGTTGLQSIITTIINVFSIIVGFVAVVMIIMGGFRYITSGGDSGKVTSAKNTILYALIGLVIVALAQIIVKYVLSRAVAVGP